jgi:hypothetical protein
MKSGAGSLTAPVLVTSPVLLSPPVLVPELDDSPLDDPPLDDPPLDDPPLDDPSLDDPLADDPLVGSGVPELDDPTGPPLDPSVVSDGAPLQPSSGIAARRMRLV